MTTVNQLTHTGARHTQALTSGTLNPTEAPPLLVANPHSSNPQVRAAPLTTALSKNPRRNLACISLKLHALPGLELRTL